MIMVVMTQNQDNGSIYQGGSKISMADLCWSYFGVENHSHATSDPNHT